MLRPIPGALRLLGVLMAAYEEDLTAVGCGCIDRRPTWLSMRTLCKLLPLPLFLGQQLIALVLSGAPTGCNLAGRVRPGRIHNGGG